MTPRLHRVAVSVTDMDPSIAWYKTCSASSSSATSTSATPPRCSALRTGRWGSYSTHHPKNGGEAFDPTRTGLDHIGFVMPDRAALEAWETSLNDKGRQRARVGFVPQLPGSRRHAAAARRVCGM